ncbi:MAG: TolC family outer membrane protein [Notoacmeibacter sp.]|nr:TolC family outer membrane protein [Notoacmeibacter sp.]
MQIFRQTVLALLTAAPIAIVAAPVSAETIQSALVKAYQNNSSLNSARAGVRVTDEGVAIAKSGYRPRLTGAVSGNYSSTDGSGRITTGSFGITLSQNLFDGFQTRNNVKAAEANVFAAQENLRNTGQNVLFDAASAFMDVIRDRQTAVLRKRNLEFLDEQVRAARSRFEVGEGTRTDVAQAEASRSAATAQLSAARAQAAASEATYRQIVGEAPGKLSPASPPYQGMPKSLDQAFARAEANHPAIRANKYLVEAARYSVKSKEGQFLPQVSASAGVSRNYRNQVGGSALTSGSSTYNSANIGATITVPLYQGGLASAQVRQTKEQLGQASINVDVVRDQVRANISSAWNQFQASVEAVQANRQLVEAARLALNGVIEERNVGQRTTLDVLNAQADVISAQVNLADAERNVVVASYAILSATGDLNVTKLRLGVAEYKPEEHYEAVKDKWYGLRTPDGR